MKVTIGACGRCGKDLKVKQETAKPLMRLTCGCGWSGNIGYQNCEICGTKIPAEGGQIPARLCSDSCRENKRIRQHQLDEKLKQLREEASQPRFRPGTLPPHWPNLSDSSKFWGPLQSPSLTPSMRLPYLASLAASHDQRRIAWLSPRQEKGMEIAVMHLETTRQTSYLPYRGELRSPSRLRPSCLFIGNDKLLAIADIARFGTQGSNGISLAAYDASSDLKIAETSVPKCDFCNPVLKPGEPEIVAVKESGFHLLSCRLSNNAIECESQNTQQILAPGPRFGPDYNLYVFFLDGLYRRHGEGWMKIGPGDHCMYFDDAAEKILCGGGHEDFSGPSMLYSTDMKNHEVEAFPWGFVPVEQIEPAGNGDLLIANMAADSRESTGRWAFLSLFNVREKRSAWAVRIGSLARWIPPILLSVPEEKWALIATGLTIERISLPDGKSMQSIRMDPLESVEARWLRPNRILCLARTPASGGPGGLELFEIP